MNPWGSAGVLSSPCRLFHISWALQHLVPAQAPWHRPGRAGRRCSGAKMCGGAGSPGTGHSQSCPATLLPHSLGTFPFQCLPGSRFTAALSHSLLCCLPSLSNHIFNTRDGFAPSEGDPCPSLQIPCEFLSWGSAQLWLLPVPLPYALAATALLLFCTRPLCNKLDTESPISKFWGSIHKIWAGHCHSPKKKKKGREKELTCTVFIREI